MRRQGESIHARLVAKALTFFRPRKLLLGSFPDPTILQTPSPIEKEIDSHSSEMLMKFKKWAVDQPRGLSEFLCSQSCSAPETW